MKQRQLFILLAVLALLLLFPIGLSMRESYHRWRFAHSERAVVNKQPTRSLVLFKNDHVAKNYHLERLVDLGAIKKVEYEFVSIENATPEAQSILERLIDRTGPTYIQFQSPVGEPDTPLELTLWLDPADESAWRSFLQEVDRKGEQSLNDASAEAQE